MSSTARARLDLVGLILVVLAVAWTYVAAAASGGDPDPFVALVVAAASALVLGRISALIHRSIVPAGVVVVAAVLAFRTPDLLSAAPLSGPFGYANAKGAFFLQAAIAGLLLAAGAGARPLKLFGLLAGVAFGVVPLVVESVAPAVLAFFLLIVLVAARVSNAKRVLVIGCAVLFVVALAATIVVGATYAADERSGPVNRIVDSTVSERRVALWHEALVMLRDNPGTGVGLGGFQVFSPTARSDRDARWAHNSFLQQGAETGLVGLVLLVLLFAWGFVSLGGMPNLDTVTVLGALALAALGIHACIDYILHFPAVPLTAAALVGAASVGPETQTRPIGDARARGRN